MGPLGSVFSPDDFSDREVKDTDGDGLPEFVDAWGQPLQFFRWPLLYHTDTQQGQVIDYWDYTQTPPRPSRRALQPALSLGLRDPRAGPAGPQPAAHGAGLVVVGHGGNPSSPFASLGGPAASVGGSGGVLAFEYFFHRLTEPFAHTGRQHAVLLGSGPGLPLTLGYRGPSSPNP